MSASNIVSNLQQALKCADKCDCCEKFQQQINQIKNKQNALDQDIKNILPRLNDNTRRIGNNEKEISKFRSINKNGNRNNFDKDLQKIKQQISAIERYINIVDGAGKSLNRVLLNFLKSFFK